MSFPCRPDGSCPYLYECISDSNTCQHLPVFPFTLYPLIIYCLFPFCSAICNMSGNSFGEYKVILLMDLLNYQANQATVLTYPLITGTALFNAASLIFKRHPYKNTSLIDFNIVMVLLPNNLFGSAIGGLVNKFLPPVASDSICIVLMFLFSIKFFLRYRGFKKQEKQAAKIHKPQQNVKDEQKSERQSALDKQIQLSHVPSQRQSLINENQKQNEDPKQNENPKQNEVLNIQTQISPELRKHLQYQSGIHLPHIGATFLIFLIFETLSFLAQGKIVPFSMCSVYYGVGMGLLTLVFIAFNIAMYKYTVNRMQYYRNIQYSYECSLDDKKNYLLVCLGGFVGGFNGGVFGIGASTTMIFTLLYLKTIPAVVSATVGFEVVFIGLGSLCQALATNQIAIGVAGFFFLQTLIFGGILTFFARRFLNRFRQVKVNQCLMLIVFSLVSGSFLALIVSIVLGYLEFGAESMDSVPFSC